MITGTEVVERLAELQIAVRRLTETVNLIEERTRAVESPGESAVDIGNVPASKILGQWNGSMKQRARLTDKRRRALRQRWADDFFREHWSEAIDRIASSPFCRGGNDRGWSADIDFFLRPDTVTKTMEGKYDGKTETIKQRAFT